MASKKRILLTRKWDGHDAGEIIEEADYTVESMIRKGYGTPYVEPKSSKVEREVVLPRGPVVETADLPGAAEAAVVSPQIGARGKHVKSDKPDAGINGKEV